MNLENTETSHTRRLLTLLIKQTCREVKIHMEKYKKLIQKH